MKITIRLKIYPKNNKIDRVLEWRYFILGLKFKQYRMVGTPNWIGKLIGDKVHTPEYIINIELLLIKIIFKIVFGKTMIFKTNNQP